MEVALSQASADERRAATAKWLHQDVSARVWARGPSGSRSTPGRRREGLRREAAAAAAQTLVVQVAPVAPVVVSAPHPAAALAVAVDDVDQEQDLVLES
ncbi:hypothetical protein ABZ626_16775 [Streptomyces longispororuber]|uniref:hypothetical protein n=1 Tax=Streptomyces longispororuber TaxID=68230 RepID=UPI0033C55147